MTELFTTSTEQVIKVHDKERCRGACPIHNPSDHHMRDWPLVWRDEREDVARAAMLNAVLGGEDHEETLDGIADAAWAAADDLGLHGWLERVCPHGIGHPDPDSMRFAREYLEETEPSGAVHGCDGCCLPEHDA